MLMLSDKVLSKLNLQRLRNHHRTVMATLSRLTYHLCSCGDPSCDYDYAKYTDINSEAITELESYKKKVMEKLYEQNKKG